MLNTLFLPVTPATARHLTPKNITVSEGWVWALYRFNWKNGKQILDRVMKQGAQETAWLLARNALDKCLRPANEIISDCLEINDPKSIVDESSDGPRKSRKVGSGISFNLERLDTPSGSSSSSGFLSKRFFTTPQPKNGGSGRSESRRNSTRCVFGEIRKRRIGNQKAANTTFPKNWNRWVLSMRARNTRGSSSSDSPYFDIGEFKRKRLIWEVTGKAHNPQSIQAMVLSRWERHLLNCWGMANFAFQGRPLMAQASTAYEKKGRLFVVLVDTDFVPSDWQLWRC